MPEAVYLPDRGGFLPTELARGPWDPEAQHGGAPAALLATLLRNHDATAGLALVRITVEFLRPVPLTRLEASVNVVRPGRRVVLVEAELLSEGVIVCRALGLCVRPAPEGVGSAQSVVPPADRPGRRTSGAPDAGGTSFGSGAVELRFAEGDWSPGPATVWARLLVPVVAGWPTPPLARTVAAADFANGVAAPLDFADWVFINPDLTVYFDREPAGEWVCLRAASRVHAGAAGISESELFDEDGRIGRGIQALYIAPR